MNCEINFTQRILIEKEGEIGSTGGRNRDVGRRVPHRRAMILQFEISFSHPTED